MPIRLLREGILTSERIDQLDAPAEVFYRRLMSKVDDFGFFDARPAILRSSLYPLRVDRVREADIARWIAACEKAGVIALYQHAGKPYLQMLDTGWQTRSEPKYPLPPWGKNKKPRAVENSCEQPETAVPVVVVGVVVEDEGIAGTPATPPQKRSKGTTKTRIPDGFSISERVIRWAAEKGYARLDEHLEAFIRKCNAKGYTYDDWDSAFMEAIREDWAKLRGGGRSGAAPAAEASSVPSNAGKQTADYIAQQALHALQKTAPPADLKDIRNNIAARKSA